MTLDVVIVGAGAAGLMCAIEAGKRGRSVAVLERNPAIGKKIRISGGGRCNFTNIYTGPEHFISGNPNFHKSALARFTPEDFIRLVRRNRIAYHEKKLGQLFCDGTSQQIIGMLLNECEAAGVDIHVECAVSKIEKNQRFALSTNLGELDCASLVIATGGLSIPKIGATDFGYAVARQFGLRITDLRPALVPLTLSGDEGLACRELSGISLDAVVTCGRTSFRENLLFTHRGLSGPAILQISSYWRPGDAIVIDVLQENDRRHLPRRFIQKWRAGETAAMEARALRFRRLCESRGHARRCGYPTAFFQDDGDPAGAGPILYRRSGRRHRSTGRIQFSVGLGIRVCSRPIRINK